MDTKLSDIKMIEIANKLLAEQGLFRPQNRGYLAPFMAHFPMIYY